MFEDRDWLMTQQAEADDRGDDAAADVATHGTHDVRAGSARRRKGRPDCASAWTSC